MKRYIGWLITIVFGALLAVGLTIRYRTRIFGPAVIRDQHRTKIFGPAIIQESWSYNTGAPWPTYPPQDGYYPLQPRRGEVFVFNSFIRDEPWDSPVVGSDGTIYAVSAPGTVALDATGHLKRHIIYGGEAPQLLIADDGSLWGAGPIWRLTVEGNVYSSYGEGASQIALSPQGLLLGCGKKFSFIIDSTSASNSRVTREFPNGGQNPGPLSGAAFNSQGAVVIDEAGNLTSWPLDFRQPNWRRTLNDPGCRRPTLARDGTIYLACKALVAINADGSDKWSFPITTSNTNNDRASAPSIGEDGVIYFGTWFGNVYSLNPDASVRWKIYLGGMVRSTPAISRSGVIYVGTTEGKLYALDSSGVPIWVLQTKGEVFSPTISLDGTVYAQSADGILHAIAQPGNGGLAGQWPKQDSDAGNTSRAQ